MPSSARRSLNFSLPAVNGSMEMRRLRSDPFVPFKCGRACFAEDVYLLQCPAFLDILRV